MHDIFILDAKRNAYAADCAGWRGGYNGKEGDGSFWLCLIAILYVNKWKIFLRITPRWIWS